MNNNELSNNLNQNLISEHNQYQISEEINLIQLSDENEPPPPNSNYIPLEVSLPPAKLPEKEIPYEGQQNINEPAPNVSPPSRGGLGKQKMIKLTGYKKKKRKGCFFCCCFCYLCDFECCSSCC